MSNKIIKYSNCIFNFVTSTQVEYNTIEGLGITANTGAIATASGTNIAYYQATENCYVYIEQTINSATSGVNAIAMVDSVSDIANGTVASTVKRTSESGVGVYKYNCFLESGKVLIISTDSNCTLVVKARTASAIQSKALVNLTSSDWDDTTGKVDENVSVLSYLKIDSSTSKIASSAYATTKVIAWTADKDCYVKYYRKQDSATSKAGAFAWTDTSASEVAVGTELSIIHDVTVATAAEFTDVAFVKKGTTLLFYLSTYHATAITEYYL